MLYMKDIYMKRSDFNLKIDELKCDHHSKVALLGKNGSGKSTFFNIITGLLKPQSGIILYNNKALEHIRIDKRARLFAYLPQFFTLIFNFTVFEIIHFGRYPFYNKKGVTKDDKEKTNEMIELFDLTKMKHKRWCELSGGEKQRVAIAKTLNQETACIYLDEPLSMLDIKHQINVLKIIKTLNKLVILSTHDINLIKEYVERLIFFKNGRIAADLNINELNEAICESIYDVPVKKINNYFMFC